MGKQLYISHILYNIMAGVNIASITYPVFCLLLYLGIRTTKSYFGLSIYTEQRAKCIKSHG